MSRPATQNPNSDQATSAFLEVFPRGDLAALVERLWVSVVRQGPGHVLREVIPDGNVDLLLCLAHGRCGVHLFGPATRPMAVHAPRGSMLACIRFHPGQAPRLADVSHADLLDACLPLDAVLGLDASAWGEQLLRAPDLKNRIELLAASLRRMHPAPMTNGPCRRAARMLLAAGGDTRIADLARELGMSVRGLERLFVRELGLGPKALARLVRLQRAVEGVRAADVSHAELAAHCGFSDQAHMINEFQALAGCTPGSLAQGQVLAEPRRDMPAHVLV